MTLATDLGPLAHLGNLGHLGNWSSVAGEGLRAEVRAEERAEVRESARVQRFVKKLVWGWWCQGEHREASPWMEQTKSATTTRDLDADSGRLRGHAGGQSCAGASRQQEPTARRGLWPVLALLEVVEEISAELVQAERSP